MSMMLMPSSAFLTGSAFVYRVRVFSVVVTVALLQLFCAVSSLAASPAKLHTASYRSEIWSDPGLPEPHLPVQAIGLIPGADSYRAVEEFLSRNPFLPEEDLQESVGELQAQPSREDPLTWTFLFYDDADFTNGFDPLDDFSQDARSSGNVNVLVLQDENGGPTRLWYITATHEKTLLADWGEMNMGASATMDQFIQYAKTNYPADRYLMTVYDHGAAWMGSCVDNTDGDILRNSEMAHAISNNGGIDILCFTAPCLMGSIEAAYEIGENVEVYIGSEELSGYMYWFETMSPICALLDDSSHLSTIEVGQAIVEVVENTDLFSHSYLTMSALRSDKLATCGERMSALSATMLANFADIAANLRSARSSAWEMGLYLYDSYSYIDLYDLFLDYQAIETNPVILQQVQDLLDSLDELIIYEIHGIEQPGAHGLNIYFPPWQADFISTYNQIPQRFTDDTVWGDLLTAYYNAETSGAGEQNFINQYHLFALPNPFNQSTDIHFEISTASSVKLEIFDLSGRVVRTVCDGFYHAGEYHLQWDGCDDQAKSQPAGLYLYRLTSANGVRTRKLQLVR